MIADLPAKFSYQNLLIPSSKSYMNRALIVASILKSDITIFNPSYSQDSLDLIENLRKLGLEVLQNEDSIKIKRSFPACEQQRKSSTFFLGEGGTSFRFFLALISRGQETYQIDIHERLKNRPHEELFKALKELDVKITSDKYPLEVQGPLSARDIFINCEHSTQFFSAIKLSTFDFNMRVNAGNVDSSSGYIDITNKVIEKLQQKNEIKIPVDYSCAANIIALGALFDGVCIKNAFEKDVNQGDSQILDFLESQGGGYLFSGNGLVINPLEKIKPFEWDCSNCLDLVPVLCIFAAKAQGESRLTNIKNLIFKESNRLEEMKMILQGFGVESHYNESSNTFIVQGTNTFQLVAEFTPFPDHRMIMMASLLMILAGGGKIRYTNVINKSFPGFFECIAI